MSMPPLKVMTLVAMTSMSWNSRAGIMGCSANQPL
jgi:hypothetical protein